MTTHSVHPLGRLFQLQHSLQRVSDSQLSVVAVIESLYRDSVISEACLELNMHALQMAGIARRMAEVRRDLSQLVP